MDKAALISANADEVEAGLLRLPEHLRDGLRAYVLDGKKPGAFLVACIENDLNTAAVKADPTSFAALPALAKFFYNDVPRTCWGSRAARQEWQRKGGIAGWVNDG